MVEDRQPIVSHRSRDPVTGDIITTYDHWPGWKYVDVPCSSPTAKQVEKWFKDAGPNMHRKPSAGRWRVDYPTPSERVCEDVAWKLSSLDFIGQKNWHNAAAWAWQVAAFAWRDRKKQPARLTDDSAIVHFVWLALAHFRMHRGKQAIERALKKRKKLIDKFAGGVVAARRGPVSIMSLVPERIIELGCNDKLYSRIGRKKYPS